MSDKNENVAELILEHVRIASDMSEDEKGLPWYEIGEVFFHSVEENRIKKKFPILLPAPKNKESSEPEPFEYDGRDWYYWVNVFASKYGWKVEQIENLDPDDAFGLLMEIQVSEFTEKEFTYRLSEMAYAYDKTTKKSRYLPLPKPHWMRPKTVKEAPKRKILRKLIPPGVVIRVEHEAEDIKH